MSEQNISEKLANSISKLIKKTETFEKVDTMLKCVSIFMLITGTISFFNYYKIEKLKNNLDKKDEELRLNMFETIMEVKKINKKLDIIIEINEYTSLLIENQIQDQEMSGSPFSYLNDSTISTTSLIPFTNDNNNDNINHVNNNNHDNNDINDNIDDNELLNESYDIIPCNNSKKVIGLNKIFGW